MSNEKEKQKSLKQLRQGVITIQSKGKEIKSKMKDLKTPAVVEIETKIEEIIAQQLFHIRMKRLVAFCCNKEELNKTLLPHDCNMEK